ncbi:MAG: hypothetical protein ACI8RZ_000181 [Myxococcota bacterium]|jgi:hypothetical protein
MKRTILLLVVLNIVLQIPWSLHRGMEPYLTLVIVGELAVLAGLCMCWPKWGGRALLFGLAGLMLVEIDRLVGVYLMSHDPLFYDQVFLMRHFLVLLSDLWTVWWTAAAVALVAAGSLLAVMLRRAVKALADGLPSLPPRVLPVGLAVLVVGTMLSTVLPKRTGPVRWISVEIAANLEKSVRIWRGVRAAPEDSPYQAFSAVTLERRPDVRFYIIESYGRILASDEQTAPRWKALLAEIEADLSADGWHSVSAYSQAPVSGGRSWLADGSVLMGMPIAYESLYRHLLLRVEEQPDMVDFFDTQGYRTVRLAPKDRARPGIELTNDFHFQQPLSFIDLDYTGPALGWGWIPDQHSLGVVEERLLEGGPLFLFFHMVSAHIPWETPPPILTDWRALSMLEGTLPEDRTDLTAETLRQLKRYRRNQRYIVRSGSDALTMSAYFDAVAYDLEILRQHLKGDQRDSLIILMGDHQPPLVTRGETRSRDVPVHILSRDPELLKELSNHGFSPGLTPNEIGKTTLRHAGIFSLLVRTLAACCGESEPLPTYTAQGVRPHP